MKLRHFTIAAENFLDPPGSREHVLYAKAKGPER